jgi:hypothetical protein
MLTFGEGWHNNHHAHPQVARHGLAWYEPDFNWYGISILRMIHLAWDVKTWKLRPDEDKTVTAPRRLDARNQEGRCWPLAWRCRGSGQEWVPRAPDAEEGIYPAEASNLESSV